jgi:hypothetical protein
VGLVAGVPILREMNRQDWVIGPPLPKPPPLSQPAPSQVEQLRVLTVRECLDCLHSRDLGRVAFQIDRDIDVLPVNYGTEGGVVVFRTGSMTRLQRSPRVRVSFQVDSWDPITGIGWSVLLKGAAREVTGGMDSFSKALRRRKVRPLAPGKREHWIAIYPSEVTGRRFRSPAVKTDTARR